MSTSSRRETRSTKSTANKQEIEERKSLSKSKTKRSRSRSGNKTNHVEVVSSGPVPRGMNNSNRLPAPTETSTARQTRSKRKADDESTREIESQKVLKKPKLTRPKSKSETKVKITVPTPVNRGRSTTTKPKTKTKSKSRSKSKKRSSSKKSVILKKSSSSKNTSLSSDKGKEKPIPKATKQKAQDRSLSHQDTNDEDADDVEEDEEYGSSDDPEYEKEDASKFLAQSKPKSNPIKTISTMKTIREPTPKRALELRITINNAKFVIWRKILVLEDIKFTKLARILVTAMGWTGYFKWEFDIKGDALYIDENNKLSAKKFKKLANEMTIDYYKLKKDENFKFVYDTEKEVGWVHEVHVEEIHYVSSDMSVHSNLHKTLSHCLCTSGLGRCPPDDVGSPANYAVGIEALKSKQPKDVYNKWVEYLGEDYNPDEFDAKSINNSLKIHSYDAEGLKRDAEDEDLFAW